jgi:hypothetical protein
MPLRTRHHALKFFYIRVPCGQPSTALHQHVCCLASNLLDISSSAIACAFAALALATVLEAHVRVPCGNTSTTPGNRDLLLSGWRPRDISASAMRARLPLASPPRRASRAASRVSPRVASSHSDADRRPVHMRGARTRTVSGDVRLWVGHMGGERRASRAATA